MSDEKSMAALRPGPCPQLLVIVFCRRRFPLREGNARHWAETGVGFFLKTGAKKALTWC